MSNLTPSPSNSSSTQPWRKGFTSLLVMGLIPLLLLEIITRVVWWNDRSLTLFNKTVVLLPQPLATASQLAIMDEWAGRTDTYLQYDAALGWTIRPATTAEWEGSTYTSNSIGLRSNREYMITAPTGVTRIGAFGPSFTHGDEVQGHETWQAQLEQMRPDVEAMNWGVGGYGTDQAFLRYKTQGVAYHPQIVIIGFEEDNLGRNVNRYRPYFRQTTGLPLTKPVFALRDGRVTLIENPFADFATFYDTLRNDPARFLALTCPDDYFCQPERYQTLPLDMFYSFRFLKTLWFELNQPAPSETNLIEDPYIRQVNLGVLRTFVQEVINNGAVPIVLIFPELSSIQTQESGGVTPYAAAVEALRQQGVQVIDLAPAFVSNKTGQNGAYSDYYASPGGHFNALGNQVVAQTVYWHLCSQNLLADCK